MVKQFKQYTLIKALQRVSVVSLIMIFSPLVMAEDAHYGDHPSAKLFIEKMVTDHGFKRSYVQNLMKSAVRKQSILDAIARPAEKTKTWKE